MPGKTKVLITGWVLEFWDVFGNVMLLLGLAVHSGVLKLILLIAVSIY